MILRSPILWFVLILVLAACSRDDVRPDPIQPDVTATASGAQDGDEGESVASAATTPMPTAAPTETPGPTATPTRVPTGALTICMAQEPASLYLYGPDSYAARVVREAIYDGPIDSRAYGLQAIILEKIPALADGDARLEAVDVREGQLIVDSAGNVVTLRDGVVVRPAGCYNDECAISYSADAVAEGEQEGEAGDDVQPAAIQMEQLVAEFTILDGVTWSDGQPLTAEDSVFSFEVAQMAEIPPRQRTGAQGVIPARRIDPVERTAAYEALDENKVRWTGLPGFMDAYFQGNFFTPLPKHQLEGFNARELLAGAGARLPLGWGPYVLQEWTPGEQIRGVRNENYFRAAEDLPYFDEIVFRFDSEVALPQALQDGDCDIVTNDALDMQWQAYADWAAQGMAAFYHTPGTIWEHVVFGINPSAQVTWRGDLFEDARVRQAAAHCIDRAAIMNELMGGYSTVPNTLVAPDHPLHPQDGLNEYTYDPQVGMALLQQAGWRDTNGDGILESYGVPGLADGSTMVFNFVTTASALRERIGQIVVENLAQCGMRANLTPNPVPPQIFFTPDVNSPIFGRTFDVTGFAWFSDMLPPCHLYLTSETPAASTGWSGFNVAGFSSEAYDAACQTARSALPGMDIFAENHIAAMRIFNEQLPAIPLFMHLKSVLARPDIVGLEPNASQIAEIWNVESLRREP